MMLESRPAAGRRTLPSHGWDQALAWQNGRVVLWAACLLVLLQCCVLLNTRWVEDESWLSEGAWNLAQEGSLHMKIFPSDPRAKADVTPPLQRLTMAASFRTLGLGVVQARLPSILFAVGTVVVTFLFARLWAGPAAGAISALVVATDTFLIVTARTARPETHTACLAWLTVLLCFVSLKRRSVWIALLSGISGGLALTSHPLALPFVAAVFFFLWQEFGWRTIQQKITWAFALGLLASATPYAAWCFSDADHIASFRGIYLSKASEPFHERIYGEARRWADFIGMGSQRVQLPVRIPTRLHIAAGLTLGFFLLFRNSRKQATSLLLLLALNIVWWLYMVNKGPRYIALVAPLFSILLGTLAAFPQQRRSRLAVWALIALIVFTQLGGNAYWLYKYRTADYAQVTRELKAIIPPASSVYGITTFWMALHDRTYYAYDRTEWAYALDRLQPEYLILYDRVMLNGSGNDVDTFADLRTRATSFVRQHGQLAGKVSNPFYGDLEVYRVSYPQRRTGNGTTR